MLPICEFALYRLLELRSALQNPILKEQASSSSRDIAVSGLWHSVRAHADGLPSLATPSPTLSELDLDIRALRKTKRCPVRGVDPPRQKKLAS